ncbi:class I SAM-dependent methyltransferase [Phaeobacter piscinae]|uniref:class I SAM-dependent methyltransferase n=1 Tax=Phaeobacter piscinae TaxID=1580596 RepID=UPI000C9ADCFC|nr:class I SAM-dependent methyltransferase [Phaeobacter piscinae]AUQ75283.1 putative methyltransferase YrrT [Phaeobacter piscinae]
MPNRWNDAAHIRRNQIESGADVTFNDVFKPALLDLISNLHPENILEVGAGTGHLSKDISNLGLNVTAIEPSTEMYKVAQEVLSQTDVRLLNVASFDVTPPPYYDLAISHLVAHTVDDLEKFLRSIQDQLREDGCLIFSIPHPCFYNDYKKFFGEEYNYMTPMSKEVSFTITKEPQNVISGVPYHHRPISHYINSINSSGLLIEGLIEVYPDAKTQEKYGSLWSSPRYCIFNCKRIS